MLCCSHRLDSCRLAIESSLRHETVDTMPGDKSVVMATVMVVVIEIVVRLRRKSMRKVN